MSLRLTSISGSAYGYISRVLTAAIATNEPFFFGGWSKVITDVPYNPHYALTNATNSRSSSVELYTNGSLPNAAITGNNSSALGGDTGITITVGNWFYRGLYYDGNTGGGNNAASFSGTAASNPLVSNLFVLTLTSVMNHFLLGTLADIAGALQPSNIEFEHVRMYRGAGLTFSEPEVRAERDSTTPVKAGAYFAWSMVNAADTADISGNGRVWTGTTVGGGSRVTNGASNSPPGAYVAGGGSAPIAAAYQQMLARNN